MDTNQQFEDAGVDTDVATAGDYMYAPETLNRVVVRHADGRISLARFGVAPGDRFSVYEHPDGTLILTPLP